MRSHLISALIVSFIAGEIIVTLLPGQNYVWRMFSTRVPEIRGEMIDTAGTHRPLDWYKHVSFPRKGVDFWNLLPPHLCRTYPEAASVALHRGTESKETTCR